MAEIKANQVNQVDVDSQIAALEAAIAAFAADLAAIVTAPEVIRGE